MTEQDFRHEPAGVEISAPSHYARAGARVDHDPAQAGSVRATIAAAQPAAGPGSPPPPRALAIATAPGERWTAGPGERQRYGNGRYAPNPLAARADRIHDLGHDGLAAARTRLDRLAAAVDYLRSAVKAGARAGVTHAQTELALDRITADLMAAGDRHVDVLRAWRAAS